MDTETGSECSGREEKPSRYIMRSGDAAMTVALAELVADGVLH